MAAHAMRCIPPGRVIGVMIGNVPTLVAEPFRGPLQSDREHIIAT